jgi:hypothetical protein
MGVVAQMGVHYPHPDNEDAFEQCCLRFYRKHWKNESLELYAKRGEEQFGVDIHDPVGISPIGAVQCKHHERTKTLPPAEIQAEVAKAETWHQPLERYLIATTAKKSKNAQDTVAALNARPDKKFTVLIQFWEDICGELSTYPRVEAESIVHGHDAAADFVLSMMEDSRIKDLAERVLNVNREEPSESDYAEIESLLKARDLNAARFAISKFPQGAAFDRLSVEARYKITRFRGKYALETSQFEAASQLFFEAFALQPHLDQAKQNRVLAYSLINEKARAFALANQYLAEGLTTVIMLARVAENAPTREEVDKVMPLIEPHLETDEELNLVLAHRLIHFGDPTGARAVAKRAVTIAPESTHAHYAAASSAHNEATGSEGSKRKAALIDALTYYTSAEKYAIPGKYEGLLSEIRQNRGAVNAMLHNIEAAKADYRASVTESSAPSLYAAKALSFFVHIQDTAGAEELLQYLDAGKDEDQFFAALTRFDSAKDDETRRKCIDTLIALADKDWSRSVDCRLHCVDLALRIGDPDLARSVLTEEFEKAHPFQANTGLAWIAAQTKKGDAAEYARKAVEVGVADTQEQDRRVLADILIVLGDHATALSLLEHNVTRGVLNYDAQRMIDCAQRLERHDLLLRLCRELRESGEQNDGLRRLEMQLLSRYAPEQGLELADYFIGASAAPGYFVAFRNWLAVRLNRQDLLNFTNLPKPNELAPSESLLISDPYAATKKFNEGIDFLYVQLRLNFDDVQAHKNYINFIRNFGNDGTLHKNVTRVEGECAVLLELSDSSTRWVVIENENPVPSRGEFGSDCEMAKCLESKAVGEVITLPGGMTGPEQATIKDVQSKYVRAFQDSGEYFRARFPEVNFLQWINVGDPKSLDLTEIIEAGKKAKQGAEQAVQFYTLNPCTIYLLGERIGANERDTMFGLTQHETARIKCSEVKAGEFGRLIEVGVPNEKIVLTVTAIVTLELLDGWDLLDPKKEYFISRTTFELIEHWVAQSEANVEKESAHSSVTEDGKLQLYKPTREEREKVRVNLLALKRQVESLCKVSSAESIAAIEPSRRNAYERVAGFHNLEAVGLAKELDAALWADDIVLAFIGKAEFGLNIIWTQLALKSNADAGIVSVDAYNRASAKLVGHRYESTVWNVDTIIQAGEMAGWDAKVWPFRECMNLLSLPNMTSARRARLLLGTLRSLRGSSCPSLMQSAVTQALLTAVRNPALIAAMYDRLDDLFGRDFLLAEFFAPEFLYWLKHHLS